MAAWQTAAMLTINRNTHRVSLSFERTKFADDSTQIRLCGKTQPRQQVLMNCTAWVAIHAGQATSAARMCDFSSE